MVSMFFYIIGSARNWCIDDVQRIILINFEGYKHNQSLTCLSSIKYTTPNRLESLYPQKRVLENRRCKQDFRPWL